MARGTTQRNREQGGVAVEEDASRPLDQAVTKGDAIAKALKELGKRASTQDLIGYALQKFSMEVSPSYVSLIRKKAKKRGQGREGSVQQVEVVSGEQNGRRWHSPVVAKGLDPARLVMEVKDLAQRAGGLPALKRLVDALVE